MEYKVRSVAFCCISTGEFHFPNEEAAEIAVKTVTEALEKHSEKIDRIIFNVFKDMDVEDTMAAFDSNAKELVASMQEMNKVMVGISENIEQESGRVEALTETINGVASNMTETQNYTSVNDEVSNRLKEEIMKFKTI